MYKRGGGGGGDTFLLILILESALKTGLGKSAIMLSRTSLWILLVDKIPFHSQAKFRRCTSHEPNANETNPLLSLISIQFGSCEVRLMNLASVA